MDSGKLKSYDIAQITISEFSQKYADRFEFDVEQEERLQGLMWAVDNLSRSWSGSASFEVDEVGYNLENYSPSLIVEMVSEDFNFQFDDLYYIAIGLGVGNMFTHTIETEDGIKTKVTMNICGLWKSKEG